MMLKIMWGGDKAYPQTTSSLGSYHVWQMDEYFVEPVCNVNPPQLRILLDISKHDILMQTGDIAYIMNDNGKTVETIRPS